MLKKLSEIRNNILISKRLKAFIAIISFLIVVLGFVSVRSISTINTKINEINEVYLKSMLKLSGLVENIYAVLIESHIFNEKSLSDNAIDNSLNVDLINTYLNEYEYSIIDDSQKALYESFKLEFQNYISILKEVNSLQILGKYELANELKSEREIFSFKKLQSLLKQMMQFNVDGIQKSNLEVNRLKNNVLARIYFISALLLILFILITTFLIQDINKSIKLLTKNLSILKEGEIPEKQLWENKNEVGIMSGLVNSVTSNLDALNKFAKDISKGNYSSEYTPAGENDLLGKALVNLRNNLRVAKEEDERRKIDEERRNWTNKGHALFGEILRQRSLGVTHLTDDIIKNLVYYLKANQGGLFLINDSSEILKIELVSAFAYDRKKFFERSINLGDGLIGTVALERNTIYLKEIPEDYIEIESGLGDSTPKSLLIVPLKFEDDILGIVEIASFKEFEKYEIKFVEEVAQSIASTLLTARINARTEQLLEESRKQSEELASQEVEARQNMEEMRATQELAERREAALSGILSAVDNTLMKGEYELDGTLISVNNRHLQTMGYQLKEIKGKNIEIFIPNDELEHFRKVWASVIAGTPRQLEVKRRTKTGEILWLINQYTPVTDISGKISRVLYLAHDITRYKKSEEESEARSTALEFKDDELQEKLDQLNRAQEEVVLKNNELNSILGAISTEQVVIEFDLKGKIVEANKRFEQLSKVKAGDLRGKKLIQLFKVDKSREEFDEIWAKVLSGKSSIEVNHYENKEGESFWLKEFYTAINDAKGLPNKIVSIAIDITQFQLAEQQNIALRKEIEAIASSKQHQAVETAHQSTVNFEKIINAFNQSFPCAELDADLNFITLNNLFKSAFKYNLNDLKARPITRIVSELDKEFFSVALDNLKPGIPEDLDMDLMNKDNEAQNYTLKIIPIGEKSIEKVVVYFIKNIEEEVDSETSNQLSNALKNKQKELEEMKAKIEKMKHSDDLSNDYDSEEEMLYNQWINKLKNNE